VPHTVKTRAYRSPRREEQAAQTRLAVLASALGLLTEKGYDATTVTDIATSAGVSVDTVYTSVGRKPELVVAVVDMTLGTSEEPVPAEQRSYVRAIRAAPSGREKIGVYAASLGRLMPRSAPLMDALCQAARTDERCAAAWSRLSGRRAADVRLFAADLRATGDLRQGLSDAEVADFVWSTNGPEYYLLLRSRGWSTRRYAGLLEDLWCRMLLEPSAQSR
jgi:AcrR family transcriptional regulator